MKSYFSFFKMKFFTVLQYRFAAIAGIATQFFWGATMLMVYEAYYRTNISMPMEWGAIVSYMWLGQAFFMLTRFNQPDEEISNSIITGSVCYELTRPLSLYWFWFSKILAGKMGKTLIRCIPILVITVWLPAGYALSGPVSFGAFCLFVLTMLLGVLLIIGISMLIYVLMFYMTSSKGLFNVYAVIAEFFAGGVLPIPFMPAILQKICYLLPFRLTFDLPYRLYVGAISLQEGVESVFLQLAWIFIVVQLGRHLLQKSVKKLVIQGG